MASEAPKETCRISFIQGSDFASRRVDGVLLNKTDTGIFSLAFYVERIPLTGWAKFSFNDGRIGDIIESEAAKEDAVVEFQQEILLSGDEARHLRNRLNQLLGDQPT